MVADLVPRDVGAVEGGRALIATCAARKSIVNHAATRAAIAEIITTD